MQKSNKKKGMIFTICVFLIAAVLFDLSSFIVEHTATSKNFFLPLHDGQILNSRLSELTQNAQGALGISTNLYRENNNLTLRIDGSSMPFADQSIGMADLGEYKSYYQNIWTTQNNISCTLNTDTPNTTGILLQTNDKINYSQINSYSLSDYAQLSVPQNYNFSSVVLNIYCVAPKNASYLVYDEWSNSGGSSQATINYTDSLGNTHTRSVLFSQSVDESYSASYYDSDDDFIQKFDFELIDSGILNLSASVNETYSWFTLSKQNISCEWNLSLSLNYSNSSPISLFIPINTTLKYQNASYVGYLPIAKK